MLDIIEKYERRLDEINNEMVTPGVLSNQSKMTALSRERRHIEEILEIGRKYKKYSKSVSDVQEILDSSSDPEMAEMAREELEAAEEELPKLAEKLEMLLVPRDPNDSRNAMMEIRAGTGGEEAAIFAADLYRMYTRFAERQGWKVDTLSSNPTGVGGLKEVIFLVNGDSAYGNLKFESGVHRVQRVPQTESQGRIHTSAATVAVLLEAEEVDIAISDNELKIDVYRSSGPGGQSVNTTDSAVRITHLPTGTVVTCQDEKSQHKNKAKALMVLRARLLDRAREEQNSKIAQERKSMVSSGDRSAKIRTYNFPQSRVTDHRIGLTLHRLDDIMNGEIDDLIDSLRRAEHEKKMKLVEKSGQL